MTSRENPSEVADAPQRILFNVGVKTALAYAVLLLPTVLVFIIHDQTGEPVSHLFETAWRWPKAFFPQWPKWAQVVLADGILFTAIGLATLFYLQGYRRLKRIVSAGQSLPLRPVLWGVAAFSLILLTVIPFHSRDILGYINRGAQQAFYGLNPYWVTIAAIPGWESDPMFHDHWVTNPSPYGFLFMLLTNILAYLGWRDFWTTFLLFKLVNLLVYLGATTLVYQASRNPGDDGNAVLNVYLFGWSPFLLLHIMANGHNDLMTGALLLASFAVFGFKKPLPQWSFPAFLASVLVKYTSLAAFPWLVIGWMLSVRDRLATRLERQAVITGLWVGAFLGLFLLLACAWPYLSEAVFSRGVGQPSPLDAMASNATMSQHSLHSALYRIGFYAGKWFFPGLQPYLELWRQGVKLSLWIAFGIFLVWRFLRFSRLAKEPRFPLDGWMLLKREAVLTLSVLLLLVSSKFNAWYLAAILPMALTLPKEDKVRQSVWWVSMVQLLAFTPLENLHVFNFFVLTGLPLGWVWFSAGLRRSGLQGERLNRSGA